MSTYMKSHAQVINSNPQINSLNRFASQGKMVHCVTVGMFGALVCTKHAGSHINQTILSHVDKECAPNIYLVSFYLATFNRTFLR